LLKKIEYTDEELLALLPTDGDSIVQELAADNLQEEIDTAIDNLPERCRLVFVLSRFEEMSYRQIAEQLNISMKTVENQISKALKSLRIALADHLPLSLLLFILTVF